MKQLLAVAAAVLFIGFTAARADTVILQEVEGLPGQSGNMTIKIKGDKTRADISPEMSSVTDGATGDSLMLMHRQKSYMKITAERTRKLMEQMKKFQAQNSQKPEKQEEGVTVPKATGNKQRIGTYDTQEYLCQVGSTNVHYWITQSFPNWEKLQQQLVKNQEKGLSQILQGKAVNLKALPGMPIRTEMEFNGQKIVYTVISIKEENLPDTDFEVPSDYKEMAMPSFGGE